MIYSVVKNGSAFYTSVVVSLLCFFVLHVYVIISNKSWTLPFGNQKNISRICLSPDGKIIITIDDG